MKLEENCESTPEKAWGFVSALFEKATTKI
jgi:hypothetical protein